MAKILTVFGATGQQGGALIQHVLRHSQLSELYKVRGVTRDASGQISQALADQGVEMVEVRNNGIFNCTKTNAYGSSG
jgi:uncharacterized protein YbjT (DUF2867 family)